MNSTNSIRTWRKTLPLDPSSSHPNTLASTLFKVKFKVLKGERINYLYALSRLELSAWLRCSSSWGVVLIRVSWTLIFCKFNTFYCWTFYRENLNGLNESVCIYVCRFIELKLYIYRVYERRTQSSVVRWGRVSELGPLKQQIALRQRKIWRYCLISLLCQLQTERLDTQQ